MIKNNLSYLCGVIFLLMSFSSMSQVTAYVTDTSDSGVGTLRAAINSNADTVVINISGELKLMTPISISRNVRILGPSPIHFSINLSSFSGVNGIFNFNNNNVHLSGLAIKNAQDNNVFIVNSQNFLDSLILEDCLFENNKKENVGGGGVVLNIDTSSSYTRVSRCSFFSNVVDYDSNKGGAILISKGSLDIYNCTFSDNESDKGGAIRISGNAGYLTNNNTINIINNTFVNNLSLGSGNQSNDISFRKDGSEIRVLLKNNIFNNFNDISLQPITLSYFPNWLSLNSSSANNYTSFQSLLLGWGFMYKSINLQLNPNYITDGFGLKYYVFNDESSDCIDMFGVITSVEKYDARKSWRNMRGDLGGNDAFIDAGAIEYTPYVVKNNDVSGVGSFDEIMTNYISSGGVDEYSVVFEIPSIAINDHKITLSNGYNVVSSASLIINGFSQEGSRVPGPKNTLGILQNGIMGVELNGVSLANSTMNLQMGGGTDLIVSGLSVINNLNAEALNCVLDNNCTASIEGCHIGVGIEGFVIGGNKIGLSGATVSMLSGLELLSVGCPNFMNDYNHNARNVISSNEESQIKLNFESKVKNNFIGLNSLGDAMFSTSSKGIDYNDLNSNNSGIDFTIKVGGDNFREANYFCGQDVAIHFINGNDFVINNNFFGLKYDGLSVAPNNNGVMLEMGVSNIISENIIANCINNGNAITLKNTDTTTINKNIIGLAIDSSRATIGGVGIKIYGSSGDNSGFTISGGYNAINNNTISSCGIAGIEYGVTSFFNAGSLYPSDTVYLIDEIMFNIIGTDTTSNYRNFSNNKGIVINDSIQGINIHNNIIGNNTIEGIALKGGDKIKYIKISKNSIFSNGGVTGLGIDLDGNTTTNIDDSSIPLSNKNLLPPRILGALYCTQDNKAHLHIKTKILDFTKRYKVDFFKVDPNNQEGKKFIKDTIFLASTLANGWFEDTLSFSASVLSIGETITSTLTEFDLVTNLRTSISEVVASTSEFGVSYTIGSFFPTLSVYKDTLCVNDSSSFQFSNYGSLISIGFVNSKAQVNDSTYYFYGDNSGNQNLEIQVDSLGCSFTLDTTIVILSLPIVNVGNDSSICQSSAIDLSTIANIGQWQDINGVSLTNTSQVINSPTSFIYEVSDGVCQNRDTLLFNVNLPTTGVDIQEHCDSYTWINGINYTSSNNTATHTLTGSNGCDSVVTLNLKINNSTTGIDTQLHCDSYTWIDGVTYTSNNNVAIHTLTNFTGCDSVVTLNLTINNSTVGVDTQVSCNTYTWIDGVTYTSNNNTATHTLTNSSGCDSIVALNLIINTTATGVDTQIHCDSYTWIDGVTYTSDNIIATHILTSSTGCDSVVTLNLTINNQTTALDVQEHCNSYTWIDGVTYIMDNNSATYTLVGSNGCDSVVTLNLIISTPTTGVDVQEHCYNYTWIDGITYTSDNNTAIHSLTGSNGCDSLVTLNLIINSASSGIDSQAHCSSFTWIDGVTYTLDNNTATYSLINSNGCDSVVTLNLTIYNTIPLIPSISEPITYCEGDSVLIVDTELANQGIEHTYFYNNNEQTFIDENLILVDLNQAVNYVGVYASQNGCVGDTLYVDLEFIANEVLITSSSTQYCEGDSIEFNINTSLGMLDVVTWEINEIEDTLMQTNNIQLDSVQEGIYFFVMYQNGCKLLGSLEIEFDDNCGKGNEVTTNAFSPNSSLEENIVFKIDLDYINYGVPNVVTVYNRWGDIIYKVDNYDNDQKVWNGDNLSNEQMPEGTYYYVIEVPSENFITSGWVYLDL